MPRPKGSKNKKAAVAAEKLTTVQYDEKIAAVTAEIEALNASLKAKKAELKKLQKAKAAEEAAAAAKKLEEEKKAILEAVAASGKSADEILALLRGK